MARQTTYDSILKWATLGISVLALSTSIFFAILQHQMSEKLTRPYIEMVCQTNYDKLSSSFVDVITITNRGGYLDDFSATVTTIVKMQGFSLTDGQSNTSLDPYYIWLPQYFESPVYSNTQGSLIGTISSKPSSVSFDGLRTDIEKAALKDRFTSFVTLLYYVHVQYTLDNNVYDEEYLLSPESGWSRKVNRNNAVEIEKLAVDNVPYLVAKVSKNKPAATMPDWVTITLDDLNGYTLWNLYKEQIRK